MAKAWPALDIHVPGCDPQLQELVLAELDDYQPTAFQESIESQPFRAFFATAKARDDAARALASAFGQRLFVRSVEVDDEDWAARSQASLRPVTVGRITVAPPWHQEEGAVRPLSIVIQPSMGFGTGHHATTRLILGALQNLHVGGHEVLDIGCGSGVLAIAAVRLGARSALAVDNDADAVASAAENVALNNVADRVRFVNGDFRHLSAPADIVLANLTGALLEHHAGVLGALVVPGGHLIVSGLMESESSVLPALGNFLTLQRLDVEDEWQCATFRKPGG